MIKISKIKIRRGRRKVDPKKVAELARSIDEIGLLNPVTVDPDMVLVAGLHRLEACKSLGWSEIDVNGFCSDDVLLRELAEIDENLIRHNLTAVEEAESLKRRKAIYEKMHPETKAGVAGAKASNRKQGKGKDANGRLPPASTPTFAQDTASKTGRSRTTVERAVKLATDLTPEAKAIVEGTPVAKNKTALQAIAKAPKAEQVVAAKAAVEQAKRPRMPRLRKPKKTTEPEPEKSAPPEPASSVKSWSVTIQQDGDLCVVRCTKPVLSTEAKTVPDALREFAKLWAEVEEA